MNDHTERLSPSRDAVSPSGIVHFALIDQLRAVLAWIVVASHIAWYSGMLSIVPKLGVINVLGYYSVIEFIIISGFVIAHLVVSKKEPYALYMKRRALRLFPVYYVCLAMGVLATYLSMGAQEMLLARDPSALANLSAQRASLEQYAVLHGLAHLTMLHGVIPDNILFYSQMMFLSPAWSLSLELQLYIVAPALVWVLVNAGARTASVAILFVAGLGWLYQKGVFGAFALPSFLPGGLFYFLVGVLTRIYLTKLPTLSAYPCEIAAALLGLGLLVANLLPIAIWGCVVLALLVVREGRSRRWPLLQWLEKLGRCSYSTYLVHVPIIQLIVAGSVEILGLGAPGSAILLVVAGIPLILAASVVLYRFVEMPMIEVGRRIGRGSPQVGSKAHHGS